MALTIMEKKTQETSKEITMNSDKKQQKDIATTNDDVKQELKEKQKQKKTDQQLVRDGYSNK